jgi:hypothetical protein
MRKDNFKTRQEFAPKLIGKTVEVHKLGTIRPENEGDVLYLPFPEYGICLLHRVEPQEKPFEKSNDHTKS